MDRRVVVAVTAMVLLAGVGAGAPASSDAGPPELGQLAQSFDRVEFRVAVYANASARWTFHYERTLANATDRRRFEAFADRFTDGSTPLWRDFRNQSRALARHGQRATGRNMSAVAFDRRAFVRTGLNDVGVVEMSFTWTRFGILEGSRVIVGDVFEGGLYLGANQRLVFAAGPGLRFRSVEPNGTHSGASLRTSDTVTWFGERSFADNHPRAVFVPPSNASGGTSPHPTTRGSTPSATDSPRPSTRSATTHLGTTTTPIGRGSGGAVGPAVGLLALVALAASVAALWRRRNGDREGGGAPATESGGSPPDTGAIAVDDEALLEDDERVTALLEEHGGRMRQSAIVDETGWSKSKVSMVLSEMEETDRVSKLRIGRENIVSLPGHEPDASRSPYEEE